MTGAAPAVHRSAGTFAAVRLRPGDDLIAGLDATRAALDAPAAALVTCVGSLSAATLRFADRPEAERRDGPWEIVSLTGTLDPGGRHLHAALSDGDGRVIGGHLRPGCPVRTTAEVVLLALDDLAFAHAPCPLSGHAELTIRR